MAEKTLEQRKRYIKPHCAVSELQNGQLKVRVEMPGVRKSDLDIRMEDNELRIVGRREEAGDHRYLLRERPRGDYLQVFTLDDTIDQSKADAALEKGVLTITLDLKEQVKPRAIKIKGE